MQRRFEQSATGVGSVGEAGFEVVAEGNEFIDFCDDAMLLGERWEQRFRRLV